MDPGIDLGLAQTKMQSQACLEFIGLLICENEEKFVLHRSEFAMGASFDIAASWLTLEGPVLLGGLIDLAEGSQEIKELLMAQARNCEKLVGFVFEGIVGDHASFILYSQ